METYVKKPGRLDAVALKSDFLLLCNGKCVKKSSMQHLHQEKS
jgi:hypothetical protein